MHSGSKFYREETEERFRAKYRTECWLERCLSEERICPPDAHISFVPLRVITPVPGKLLHASCLTLLIMDLLGAHTINLSVSGLEESEACWIRRVVRALGDDPSY